MSPNARAGKERIFSTAVRPKIGKKVTLDENFNSGPPIKNLIKCYQSVIYDSKLDTPFVVHCSAFGLPDLLVEMHPCGLHVCYPKKRGEFGFVQTVVKNMKLFSKRQIAGACPLSAGKGDNHVM